MTESALYDGDRILPPLLKLEGIIRDYVLPRFSLFTPPSRFRALDGLGFLVKDGTSFGIVGESGCGKSTLARTVMGLESPQSGAVYFQGKNVFRLKEKELLQVRRKMQMVFQDPYGSLDPRHTVGRSIAEPLSLFAKKPSSSRSEMIVDVLEQVGMASTDARKYPHEFSGGQRQRIALARALITKPALIVADEPVSALDVSVQAQVLNLMLDLKDEHGLTYLFISHDLSIVRHMTSQVAVMYAGQIVEQGPTKAVFQLPGHPYTRALLDAMPRPDPRRRHKRRRTALKSDDVRQDIHISQKGCRYRKRCPWSWDECYEKNPNLETNIHLNLRDHRIACHFPLTHFEGR